MVRRRAAVGAAGAGALAAFVLAAGLPELELHAAFPAARGDVSHPQSAVAASSCRLSRTMMTLGQAAGAAAALFGREVAHFDAAALRRALREDGVALTLEEGYFDAMPMIAGEYGREAAR